MRSVQLFPFSFFLTDGSRHPTRTYSEEAVFGTLPPKPISYTDFCPPPNCPSPNCNEYRCNKVEVRQFESVKYPGIAERKMGKNVFFYFYFCHVFRCF